MSHSQHAAVLGLTAAFANLVAVLKKTEVLTPDEVSEMLNSTVATLRRQGEQDWPAADYIEDTIFPALGHQLGK